MKTLVIFGAARQKGHTKQMVDLFLEHLDGEKEIIDAYRTDVKPCMDCLYQKIEAVDNIVLASPMYFHSVTGRMKVLIDRLQVYWAGHVRNDMPEKFTKKGAILMVGGAPAFENQFLGGELVLKNLLNDLSTEFLGEVCLPNSDRDSLETRPDLAEAVVKLAEKMNEANRK